MTADHVRHNREFWERDADEYQAAHGEDLDARPAAWGAWRIPEADLHVLGDVRGLDVLEYGCGAAQWTIALRAQGANAVGLDLSGRQLAHARRRDATLPVVQADAERAPFADASFDLVFCDHGAMSFCEPQRTVAEVTRMLRPGGLLAFCVTHPLVYLSYDVPGDRQTETLVNDFATLGRFDAEEGTVDWSLAPSAWIALFGEHGLVVETLHEPTVAADAWSTYDPTFVPTAWARRWPPEMIWRVRRPAS